jgi:hypothetical protein
VNVIELVGEDVTSRRSQELVAHLDLGIDDLGQEVVLVDVRPGPFLDAPSKANGYADSVRCGTSRRT